MSENIQVTIETQPTTVNLTVEQTSPIQVNFRDIAVPDASVVQNRILAQEAVTDAEEFAQEAETSAEAAADAANNAATAAAQIFTDLMTTGYWYIGDQTADGCWRFFNDAGTLKLQKRIAGVWTPLNEYTL